MDYGAKHNLIQTDTRLDLLGNRLVLIAPKDSKNGYVKIALRAVERGERLVEEQETRHVCLVAQADQVGRHIGFMSATRPRKCAGSRRTSCCSTVAARRLPTALNLSKRPTCMARNDAEPRV